MAGAVFDEVGVSLFVACAAFREIWEIAGVAKCCIFHTKCVSKMGRVRSPKRRVRDVDFMVGLSSDSVRIVFILAEARVRSPKRRVRDVDFMVGLSSDSFRIVFILAEAIQGFLACALQVRISRPAQCSRVTSLAPRIVNDVSYVRGFNHESNFRGRGSIW